MQLTPDVVALYKGFLTNPAENNCTYKPISEALRKSDTITAFHVLFEQYVNYIQKPLPKLLFYIIIQEIYGATQGNDQNGNAGYYLALATDL